MTRSANDFFCPRCKYEFEATNPPNCPLCGTGNVHPKGKYPCGTCGKLECACDPEFDRPQGESDAFDSEYYDDGT